MLEILPFILGGINAIGALGTSDREKGLKDVLDRMYANEDYIKQLPFSKEELFNKIFPIIKQLNIGAADVVASRIGAEVGESKSNVGGGQNMVDYYMQAVAPVLGKGMQDSAAALQNLVQFYGQMDDASKRRLLQLLGLEGQLAGELPNLTDFQAMITAGIQGFDIGSKIYGNMSMGNYYKNKKFPNALGAGDNASGALGVGGG